MQDSDIPTKLNIPWGNAAGSQYIRVIPQSSQIGIQDGAASLTDGFPPKCFVQATSGGTPPFGSDFNGILKLITQWVRWYTAGGPMQWDNSFSTAVGGYPNGAVVASATVAGLFWYSTADNNTSNPDTGGANWIPLGTAGPTIRAGRLVTSSATLNLTAADCAIGLNRTSGVAAMTINLPSTGLQLNQEFEIYDVVGNLSTATATVTPPGGHTIAGRATFVMNEDRQYAKFHYFGSNIWGVG